jgi:hypothetical protein
MLLRRELNWKEGFLWLNDSVREIAQVHKGQDSNMRLIFFGGFANDCWEPVPYLLLTFLNNGQEAICWVCGMLITSLQH